MDLRCFFWYVVLRDMGEDGDLVGGDVPMQAEDVPVVEPLVEVLEGLVEKVVIADSGLYDVGDEPGSVFPEGGHILSTPC